MKLVGALIAILIAVPFTAEAGGIVTEVDSTAKTFTFRTGNKKNANPAEETALTFSLSYLQTHLIRGTH